MNKTLWALAFATLLLANSCNRKDPDPTPTTPTPTATEGKLSLKIDHFAGSRTLQLNIDTYQNKLNQDFTVKMYKYYLSNFVFYKKDGTAYTQPESYYLVNMADNATKSWTIDKVPVGDYDSVSFMIGVDEARNTSGAQTGALDPGLGMFWTWNTGYIMAKIEGTAALSPGGDNAIVFHIGGYKGLDATQQTVGIKLPQTAKVTATTTPLITMHNDILTWFGDPTPIDFQKKYNITNPGTDPKNIANNYRNMLTVHSVQ